MKINYVKWGLLATAFFFVSCQKKAKESAVASDDIETIIKNLSLEEKVGQMTNLTLATVAIETDTSISLDSAKLHDVIVTHHVGSIQNVINRAYPLEDWHRMITAMQKLTLVKTRHKIPFLYCIDAVHGANYIYGGTQFPHNIALAATFNPDLTKECAAITAAETRAAGIRYNFSPVLDAGRNQQWSRLGETFGEDTYVVTQMGTAAIKGFEGDDVSKPNKVAACMKHFVGYSVPANGKDRAPANIPDIVLREYFLPPFREAVKTGAHTLMVNSGEVNGVPVHASKYLLTDVLRQELGFEGVVISDWQDILKMHERHRVAASHKEAVLLAINAGIDMCIVPFDFRFSDDLVALVKEGKIAESRIDESVRRILVLKSKLGLFTNPYIEHESKTFFAKPEYKETAYKAAAEAVTLLKNEGNVLPLDSNKKLLITGPAADLLSALHGAWSYSWQGDKEFLYPDSLNTLREVFAKHKTVKYLPSVTFKNDPWNKNALLAAAKVSDAIVLCLGEAPYAETPGNIPDLAFDPNQVDLVKTLAQSGKPIILVLLEGRPRILRDIEPFAKAITLGYWPCSQGAKAIHDVLYGRVNPSGRLPYTYPRYSGTLVTYDHKLLDEAVEVADPYKYVYEFTPQYEFGHGLSYTTFTYTDLSLDTSALANDGVLKVVAKLSNTGSRDGYETVLLYSRDLYASITPSVKRLRRFQKVFLKVGESKAVEFVVKKEDLAFVNEKLQWITEEGEFEITVGGLKKSFILK